MINNVICKILHYVDEYLAETLTENVKNNTNILRKTYCEKNLQALPYLPTLPL